MSSALADENIVDVSAPTPFPGINRQLLLGHGAPIDEQDRLGLFSDKQFEIFVEQWAFGYLKAQYYEVQRRAGAGDKGRDVIAWVDPPGTPSRQWDNYQCKHYSTPLQPSDIWVELGKLCYYTFIGDFTLPRFYKFVAPKGVGPALGALFDDPEKLRSGLIDNWERYCQKGIMKTSEVPLEGALKTYVEKFDFSIVGSISPLKLLEEHAQTRYHAQLFGSGLKARPPASIPPVSIAACEVRYVAQICEAFSEYLKAPISQPTDFTHNALLVEHYNQARVSFYCAESLKEFARDNLPDDSYFPSLMDELYRGIFHTVKSPYHRDGFERMLKTIEVAQLLSVTAHTLGSVLEPNDRTGICHHLANEDKIHWVQ